MIRMCILFLCYVPCMAGLFLRVMLHVVLTLHVRCQVFQLRRQMVEWCIFHSGKFDTRYGHQIQLTGPDEEFAETIPGREMIGWKYRGPFDDLGPGSDRPLNDGHVALKNLIHRHFDRFRLGHVVSKL